MASTFDFEQSVDITWRTSYGISCLSTLLYHAYIELTNKANMYNATKFYIALIRYLQILLVTKLWHFLFYCISVSSVYY